MLTWYAPSSAGDCTSRVHTARKAEAEGLLRIAKYTLNNAPCPDGQKPDRCWFFLTEKGSELRAAIVGGAVPTVESGDPRLDRLLMDGMGLRYVEFEEPEASYDVEVERGRVVELAREWVVEACTRLDLDPRSRKLRVWLGEPFTRDIDEETFPTAAVAAPGASPGIVFTLIDEARDRRLPLALTVELHAELEARAVLRHLVERIPGLVDDVLAYAGCLKFFCPVPFEQEPRRGATAGDWLRAYFRAVDEEPGFCDDELDDAEEFWLEHIFAMRSTSAVRRRVMVSVLALYDALTAEFDGKDPVDRLAMHRAKIVGRKRSRTQHS